MKEHNRRLLMDLKSEQKSNVEFLTDLYNYYLDGSDEFEFDQALNFTQFESEITEVCDDETEPISHFDLLADPVPDVCEDKFKGL